MNNVDAELFLEKCRIYSLVFLIIISPAFSPFFSFVISLLALFFPFNNKYLVSRVIVFFACCSIVVSLSVINVSQANFIFKNDDFTAYYNSYLDIYYNGFSFDVLTQYNGVEIGLPLVNFFIYKLIGNPHPYMVKFFYSIFQLTFFSWCIYLYSIKKKLNIKEMSILFALSFIFAKPLIMIQVSRQAISSLFIFLALCSDKRASKNIFIVFAFLFHSSVIFIYPLIKFLFLPRKRKDFIYTMTIALSFVSFLFLVYSFLRGNIISIPIINKLDFVIRMMVDEEMVKNSINTSIKLLVYIFPMAFYCVFLEPKNTYKYNVFILFGLVASFSFLPGLSNRLLLFPLYIFTGVYYFKVFFENGVNLALKYLIVCLVGFSLLALVYADFNLSRFSIFYGSFFYYLDGLNEESLYINRHLLI
ncbi:EpsG family protein [Vibrio sp. PNB22_2_2]